jgi:hypothetical protein
MPHLGVDLSATDRIMLYACTYAVGNFVFQVVGQQQQGHTNVTIHPRDFRSFAVEFWPWVPDNASWPPPTFCKQETTSIPSPVDGAI